MHSEYRLTLPFQTLETAAPKAKAVLEKAKAQLGFIPNMYAGMANSPGLLDTYMVGYDRFRKDSGFTPVDQEVVFLTISRTNGCDYCVAAHSVIADKSSRVPLPVTEAIRDGRPIPEAKLAALSAFTAALLTARGLPSRDQVETFLAAGYEERQVLELILAIAVKTLSNYSNHLFTPRSTRSSPAANGRTGTRAKASAMQPELAARVDALILGHTTYGEGNEKVLVRLH